MLNTIFHWLYGVVLPIVFCVKSIVIFVCSIVLLASPEAHSMRYDTTLSLIFLALYSFLTYPTTGHQ